jgi:hypothetical protein
MTKNSSPANVEVQVGGVAYALRHHPKGYRLVLRANGKRHESYLSGGNASCHARWSRIVLL